MIRYNKQGILLLISLIVLTPILYMLYYISNDIYFNKNEYLNSNIIKNKVHNTKATVNACFVILMRNDDVNDFLITMQQLETQFNHKFNYSYVFLNDKPFTEHVKNQLTLHTKAKIEFGLIPKEHWRIPEFLNENQVIQSIKVQQNMKVPYAGKMSYHHMCRYESGLFAQHELLKKYEYYWRVEPGVEFLCNILEDPFMFMKNHNKKYGFTIAMGEFMESIPTLYKTMKQWIKDNNIKLPENNLQEWVIDDEGEYNGRHFWSNFEIGSLDMLRSEQYLSYFNYLDQSGGFYFERWGDAPVHSLYMTLMLNKSDIHFFKNIGYKHDLYLNCPIDMDTNWQLNCNCDPRNSVHYNNFNSIKLLEALEDPVVEKLKSMN